MADKATIIAICAGWIAFVMSEIHVGTFCTKHEDCIRYCAYSKYGPEGASCCFPEKIRISKSNWIATGSSTCYCCPSDLQEEEAIALEQSVLFTPPNFGLTINKTTSEDSCARYMNTESGLPGDVSKEFCQSRKCSQAMVVMKMSFEYPSVCRAKNTNSGTTGKE